MGSCYDMCIDFETLTDLENKLDRVKSGLDRSTEQMSMVLSNSEGFLEGTQFEKAKNTTVRCLEVAKKAETNIVNANEYVKSLMNLLDEYCLCEYNGE